MILSASCKKGVMYLSVLVRDETLLNVTSP
jgi:hypothetical protein